MTRLVKLAIASCLLLALSASVAFADLKSEWYQWGDDSVVYVYDPDTTTGPMVDGDEPLEVVGHDDWNEFGIYMDYVKALTVGETIVKIVKE